MRNRLTADLAWFDNRFRNLIELVRQPDGSSRYQNIGLEFARQYAQRGWRVIATVRDPASATELTALAKDRKNLVVEKMDVSDHPGIDALAAKYAGQPIDVLINNAGLMSGPARGQMVGTIDYAEFDRSCRRTLHRCLRHSRSGRNGP